MFPSPLNTNPKKTLHAVFVSPLFDVTPFHAFDSQVMEIRDELNEVITNLELKLEIVNGLTKAMNPIK